MQMVAFNENNAYANAMFRRERLHNAWLDACAAYLRHVFGDRLAGASVIDYGFGRGNWALAFLRAGAREVVAVDAAIDNVRRLHDYCAGNDIPGIRAEHGDLTHGPLDARADVIWLYGVLQHVPEAKTLLQRLAALAASDETLVYVYAYNAGCLRQFTVETARRFWRYGSEAEFMQDSATLTRPARLRARDDLTAPHIDWYDAPDLAALLDAAGLAPVTTAPGFDRFQDGWRNDEFDPHELVCRLAPVAPGADVFSQVPSYDADLDVLRAMATPLLAAQLDEKARRSAALGLMNAHFTALSGTRHCECAIVEVFLHLLHLSELHSLTESLDGPAGDYAALAWAAVANDPRDNLPAAHQPTVLAAYLRDNPVRL